ncbi:type IV secretion system protein [Candidatus Saccharibacteria bacterium]|nr:type IV secretion system protein [Candidatus Saccharibacteria bacterium]
MKIAKILRVNVVVVAVVMFLVPVLIFVPSAFADSDNTREIADSDNARESAIKKLWYAAWADCMGEDKYDLAGWYDDSHDPTGPSAGYIESKRLNMGEWFDDDGNHWLVWEKNKLKSIAPGAYIDGQVFGYYRNGWWRCGEDHNAMGKTFWSKKPLEFNKTAEIICGFEGSKYVNGIWLPRAWDGTTCERKLEDDDNWASEWNLSDLADNYREVFDNGVKRKAFHDESVDLWNFTDRENYWVSRLTFETACVKGDPIFGGKDELTYRVPIQNGDNNNKIQYAWFEAARNEDANIFYHHFKTKTCGELAADISPGSDYFNAYRDYVNDSVKTGCEDKYREMLQGAVGEYVAEYYKNYGYGNNFEKTIWTLLTLLEDGEIFSVNVYSGNDSAPTLLSSPVIENYNNYIDNQLSQITNAKINGETFFNENAFKQLADAVKLVLSKTEIDESPLGYGESYVNIKSTVDNLEEAWKWYDEVEKQLDVINDNYNAMLDFVTSSANGDKWAYDDDGLNVTCSSMDVEDEWNKLKEGLPGAPDIDGSFDPTAFIKPEEKDEYGNAEVNCVNSGAAESLGWIVCPVLEWMTDASKDMYEKYVEPALQIKSKLFEKHSGDNNDVEGAWKIFQNIANIIFVILFMVIIFSQLTGYGIDNYGIKKILPKLIVVVILANLSYYICLIFVDLSNIVGSGLQALFDGMASNMQIPDIYRPDGTSVAAATTATNITAVVLLGMIALVGVAVWQNPAILLALLVSALGVIIAVFFLFILLSAREAAIVVLTVISPVAFICYLLPNTKKLFDKWLKFGEGLLLVYPICGLLIGGGNFASKLLLITGAGTEDNGFFQSFTAMLVGIVPIFFIPTVLKGAFAAMGNIGAKLSGFGSRARSGATSGIKRSAGFKAAQERGLARKARIVGGLDADGNAKKIGTFGKLMRGGKRNMARSRAQYLRDQDTRGREGNLMGVGYEAARVGQAKKAEAEETANYMTLINDKTRNGEDEDALLKMYDQYMDEGNKAGAVAVARIAGRRKDTAASFLSKRVTGRGLKTKEERDKLLVGNSAHSEIFRSVAKEISTGENSRTYRESSPLGFEFAAQYNRNGSSIDYTDWGSSSENIERAVDNYVTDGQQLVGAKNSSLEEIAEKMEDGTLDAAHVTRLRNLARETIQNRATTGVWDSTKAENIYRIAGMEMSADAVDDGGKATSTHTPPAATNGADNVAKEGETFSTRGGAETGSRIMVDYTPNLEQARQAMREFDAQQRAKGNRNWPGSSGA